MAAATPGDIDSLLQRYLLLLDEYTQLRAKLSELQTGLYQNLARANFSAAHGIRYGQDYYDDRMKATRRLDVESESSSEASPATFRLVHTPPAKEDVPVDEEKAGQEKEAPKEETKQQARKPPADPLRWFGILVPPSLRHAQSQAIQAVEDIVPRLATVSAEMASVEVEVRRARKRRAKAEAAVKKPQLSEGLHAQQGMAV